MGVPNVWRDRRRISLASASALALSSATTQFTEGVEHGVVELVVRRRSSSLFHGTEAFEVTAFAFGEIFSVPGKVGLQLRRPNPTTRV
jgi:hypothetical protein